MSTLGMPSVDLGSMGLCTVQFGMDYGVANKIGQTPAFEKCDRTRDGSTHEHLFYEGHPTGAILLGMTFRDSWERTLR